MCFGVLKNESNCKNPSFRSTALGTFPAAGFLFPSKRGICTFCMKWQNKKASGQLLPLNNGKPWRSRIPSCKLFSLLLTTGSTSFNAFRVKNSVKIACINSYKRKK